MFAGLGSPAVLMLDSANAPFNGDSAYFRARALRRFARWSPPTRVDSLLDRLMDRLGPHWRAFGADSIAVIMSANAGPVSVLVRGPDGSLAGHVRALFNESPRNEPPVRTPLAAQRVDCDSIRRAAGAAMP